jgi:hypothetical protein
MADVLAGPAALADAQVKHVQGTGQWNVGCLYTASVLVIADKL